MERKGKEAESPEPAQKEINEPERGCWNTGSQKTTSENHFYFIALSSTLEMFNKTFFSSAADE